MDEMEEMLRDCSICEKYEHDQEVDTLAMTSSNHSLIFQHMDKHEEKQNDSKLCKSTSWEKSKTIQDLTSDSMKFLGLPLMSTTVRKELVEIFKQTNDVGVAVIDSFHESNTDEDDFKRSFERMPILRTVHNCETTTTLSAHGWVCASVLAGKEQRADFYGLRGGTIRGVVPNAKLYLYAVGCENCDRTADMLGQAIDLAIKEKVRVISMSQGPSLKEFEDFDVKWNFKDDVIAQKTLEAFKENILVCLPAGNSGPAFESLSYGMPWCINVGACTIGKNLITTVTIGTSEKIPKGVKTIGSWTDDKQMEIKILDKLEGISMNILDGRFRPLRIFSSFSKDKEGILCEEDEIVSLRGARVKQRTRFNILSLPALPMVSLSRDSCRKINVWRSKVGKLHVKISTSRYADDLRGRYVPEFSGRGPSPSHPEIIMPDIVAPGCNILGSHPTNIPIGSIKKEGKSGLESEGLFHCQTMLTGTSLATPHAAGLFVALLSNRPEWSISRAKSAAITTAWSFVENDIPGNEFMFGAGSMQLEQALNPGLVYDESYENFDQYSQGKLSVDKLNMATFAASFTHSHELCLRILPRTLTNIGKKKASYKAEVKPFHNSLDNAAFIHVRPNILHFSANENEKQNFVLRISVTPRPMGYISALLIWKNTVTKHRVVSPIHVYHKSAFDRRLWYKLDDTTLPDSESRREMGKNTKGKEIMRSGDDDEDIDDDDIDDDKGKGEMPDERMSGQKRRRSELLSP